MTRLATWNVNSVRARFDHLARWLDAAGPDLLALQETKVRDEDFPGAALAELGYRAAVSGQKSYNGVAVLSRAPLEVLATDIPGFEDPQRRVLAVETDGFVLLDLYVPNGSEVGSDKYAYKLAWLDALHDWLASLLGRHERVAVVGDFNIAPADADVYDPEKWRGRVLCSAPERERLQRLLGLGLVDVFRRFEQPADTYSWWDYRQGAFRRNRGLRIDLVLASEPLADSAERCTIDRDPRGWEKPSDHAPVLADLAV